MPETGHKKTINNTVAKKDHENIKIKIFMFNYFCLILESDERISLNKFWWATIIHLI